jgi:hypothetical protein
MIKSAMVTNMRPLKLDDKLINLFQAAYIDLKYRRDDSDPREAVRLVFAPQRFSILFGNAAEKFRASDDLAAWLTGAAVQVDETLINVDQISHADLKYRNANLVPPGVKDAVYLAFASGCDLYLFDGRAVKFRDALKSLNHK